MPRSVYRHSPTRLWLADHRLLVRATAVLLVAAVGGGVALAVTSSTKRPRHPGSTSVPASAAFAVSSTSPSASAPVPSDVKLTVHFTRPVDASGPMPALSPVVAGAWRRLDPTTLVFDATAPFIPDSAETLTVPGGPDGVRDTTGRTLAASLTVAFKVAGEALRLQQLLAVLGYLPVSFTPSGGAPAPEEMARPQPGAFAWRWADSLQGLEDRWAPGDVGVLTKGAVMTFQDQHGLAVDGLAGPRLWTALLAAAASGSANPKPYTYVYVDKTLPQHLTLYVDGVAKFPNIPVNTGLHGADTPDGTYPVFEHLTASDMKGTNPDGTTYDDPNVPWASYFLNGDALHGFVRSSYGSPQSNGCVEMAIADAAATWPYTPIGTLVTVVGPSS